MDVFLIPVAPDRYELYCEVADDAAEAPHEGGGVFRGLVHRFRTMLADAEAARRRGAGSPSAGEERHGLLRRFKDKTMRWVVEAIAEQRLLWNLRRQTSATLHHPDDITEVAARAVVDAALKRDLERHRFWLAIDTLGFVASGAFMLVPGPNVIAYYFAFRVVGHYLSWRGARNGLDGVTWRAQPSAPLAELRRLAEVTPEAREPQVREIEARLRLEHLAAFFQRAAIGAGS
jgi:hypothetical protein